MEVLRPTDLPSDPGRPSAGPAQQPIFYYDLASPACYLAAEQGLSMLPLVPEWEPVLADQLPGAAPGASALSLSERERLEDQAAKLGIQPLRWPARWPPRSREATLAATYAKGIGRVVAFSLAAFRQAFAGGRDLGDPDTILIAGAACEMHPSALLKALGLRSVTQALEAAGARARAVGVTSLPALALDGAVFEGEGVIEAAAAALASRSPR